VIFDSTANGTKFTADCSDYTAPKIRLFLELFT
jgi:hypothetical protein